LGDSNAGMKENNLFSLSYGQIKRKNIDDNDGLLPASFETYQIVERDDIVWRLTDLQNDQRSLRTGIVRERGIITSAYLATRPTAIEPAFLAYLLRAYDLTKVFYSMGGGLRQSMKFSDVKWLPVMLPSPAEQATIAAFLDVETAKIDALVGEQERLIALLREKRQTVISHAVTKGLNPDVPMKDSGIEWLGDIPAHWEVGPVKRYAYVLAGYAFSAAEFSDDPGDWRLLRGINISPQGLRWNEDAVYWSRRENDGLDGWELATGDLVIGMDRPWIGGGIRASLITEEDLPCLLLQRVASLRPKDATDNRFLLRCFQHDAFYHHCAPDLTGVSVPHLSGGQIEEFRIPMPPFDEGRAIADYLERKIRELQSLIDASRSAITLLQERRVALIAAAVTGKINVRAQASKSKVVSIESARPSSIQPPLRAVVGAYAIRALGPLGRMAVMKGGYLAEAYAGVPSLGGSYQREAAGPYCSAVIDGMERDAAHSFGIQIVEPDDQNGRVTYHVPQDFVAPSGPLKELIGEDRATRLISLLDLLKHLSREGVEAIATLYAVWNDLLAAGKAADDDAICNGVLNDWHPEKTKKFKRADLDHWLAWIRRNCLVPDGSAPRTDHQEELFA
jgi:type I restriction enzyme S subunit